ncbi:hypothetical protein [Polaromonas sp.]|uniref:hypothetical protein n=1 Tax=Polaromonas sp. TaxID=1869339 RepID=UPI0017A7E6E3|nr:hypothetical protein [Polaromonas sp.]NML85091.1 hypothetical protein [Polaromonas sp.]
MTPLFALGEFAPALSDRFINVALKALQLPGGGAIVNARGQPRLPHLPKGWGGVFNPDPILEKESLYELDD